MNSDNDMSRYESMNKYEEVKANATASLKNDLNKNMVLHKHQSPLRWLILLFSSFLLCGDYYSYDTPYACKELLGKRFSQYSDVEYQYLFNLLYTVYVIPNIFLPFLNGIITDKLGDRRMLTILGFCVFFGALIVDIGVHLTNFPLMLVGRAIFALGGDSITVSQWTLVTEYFKEDQIGIALGLVYLLTGVGSSLNLWLSPIIATDYGVTWAFDVVVLVCFCSLILRFFLYLCDISVINTIKANKKKLNDIQTNSNIDMEEETQIVSRSPTQANNKCITRKDLKFNSRFWLNLAFSTTITASQNGFYYFSSGYLSQRWWPNDNETTAYNNATQYNLLQTVLGTAIIPIFGWVADRYTIYNTLGIIAPIILMLSYGFFIIIHPLIPMILYTMACTASYTALWSCMVRCTSQKKMGVATGLNYSMHNMVTAIVPTIDTFLQNEIDYNSVFGFLSILAISALIASTYFNILDKAFRATGCSKEDNIEEIVSTDNEEKLKPIDEIILKKTTTEGS